MQDVERCMPESAFFRKEATQAKLLDILFIFCKVNIYVGYRQGMHEILAPIFWVVSEDCLSMDSESSENGSENLSTALLMSLLDHQYVEHDAFTLFCILMQTAKSFYELGSAGTTAAMPPNSPIVERSGRIHKELLRRADPELADHLHAIEVLPQIFVM